MSQQPDLFSLPVPSRGRSEKVSRRTMCDRVRAVFLAHPNEWIDSQRLAKAGGHGGWRSRISDLRFAPYHMDIRNHVFRYDDETISEYMWVEAK